MSKTSETPAPTPTPEKRFQISFSLEGPEFQDRKTAYEIMSILDRIKGNVATGRFSGTLYSDGKEIGTFLTTWRDDPVVKGWSPQVLILQKKWPH